MKTLLFAIFSLCLPAFAAEQHIECPARYPAEDIALPQSGQWETGLVPAGIPLDGGGMYAGPIQRRGELRGSERRIKGGSVTHFGFERDQRPPGRWFVCYYGHVQLMRRVADTATACKLTHKNPTFPDAPTVKLTCRD